MTNTNAESYKRLDIQVFDGCKANSSCDEPENLRSKC